MSEWYVGDSKEYSKNAGPGAAEMFPNPMARSREMCTVSEIETESCARQVALRNTAIWSNLTKQGRAKINKCHKLSLLSHLVPIAPLVFQGEATGVISLLMESGRAAPWGREQSGKG